MSYQRQLLIASLEERVNLLSKKERRQPTMIVEISTRAFTSNLIGCKIQGVQQLFIYPSLIGLGVCLSAETESSLEGSLSGESNEDGRS